LSGAGQACECKRRLDECVRAFSKPLLPDTSYMAIRFLKEPVLVRIEGTINLRSIQKFVQ
jgi:hypothetical protein